MRRFLFVALATLLLAPALAQADEPVELQLAIKDHAFVPKELTAPAGQKIKIILTNQDSTAAEFESFSLQREKVVAANGTITVFITPMEAGKYDFFDDFHRDTTTGTLNVK